MAITTVREYGRFVARAVGGDAGVLMDPSLDPAEFETAGSAQNRPDEYELWRVTLEEQTGRKGAGVAYSLNLRKWARRRPTERNPKGYEGPVRDEFHGGVNLPLEVAVALADAFASGALDGVGVQRANTPVDPTARIAALEAELAKYRDADGGGEAVTV